jgi:hypothetical protein
MLRLVSSRRQGEAQPGSGFVETKTRESSLGSRHGNICSHKDTKTRRQEMNVELEKIATDVVDGSVKLHTKLGPGLFETVYEVVLARELERVSSS